MTRAPLSPYGNLTIYRYMIGHVQCFRYSDRDLSKALESTEMSVIAWPARYMPYANTVRGAMYLNYTHHNALF